MQDINHFDQLNVGKRKSIISILLTPKDFMRAHSSFRPSEKIYRRIINYTSLLQINLTNGSNIGHLLLLVASKVYKFSVKVSSGLHDLIFIGKPYEGAITYLQKWLLAESLPQRHSIYCL